MNAFEKAWTEWEGGLDGKELAEFFYIAGLKRAAEIYDEEMSARESISSLIEREAQEISEG